MRIQGQTITWGTPTDVGHASRRGMWAQQIRAWWAARRAARWQAQCAALERRWDARREVVRPLPAEAAMEMVTRLYGLTM
jgi:hypothetical protein